MFQKPELVRSFPYPEIRQVQKDILEVLENEWNNYDVFSIVLPTAGGKSALAKSILTGTHKASYIVPTNMLVNQTLKEFPDTRTLHRMDAYHCKEWDRPCLVTRQRVGFCKGCQCSRDLVQAKYKYGPGVYNYHIYLAHKLHRDVLVVDEAHLLQNVIKDRLAIRLWKHTYKYPHNMYKPEQVLAWIDSLPPKKQKDKKIQKLREAATYLVPEYVYERTEEEFNGKGTIRGEPEMRDCIKLLPTDITQAPPMFWPPGEVRKIIFMSGTINQKDIEQLGLSKKRILYIEGESPIAPERRPVIVEPIVSVSRNNMDVAVPSLADYIREIASHYPGQKGMVHSTYSLARDLERMLYNDKRFVFHTKETKKEVYRKFREASPDSGMILVGSGLYEGVDLPDDAGRFQILAKIPWQHMGNPAVKHIAELDPEAAAWEVIKTVVQAAGRICRNPTDTGDTYIPDATFRMLWDRYEHLFPQYFRDALIFVDRK